MYVCVVFVSRYNLSRLLDWVRCRTALCGVEEQLQPVLQASKLLQMNKTDPSAILQLCTHLNVLQVCVCVWAVSPGLVSNRVVARAGSSERSKPTTHTSSNTQLKTHKNQAVKHI